MNRIYWTRPDAFEAEVEVTAIGPCQVTTDPILFHPDEGGQPADRGTIGGIHICDIRVVEGRIVHTLDKRLASGRYIARVDQEHRRYTATQHTAQHILSGIAAGELGLRTVGVHIGLDNCTVDFDRDIDWGVVQDLERRAMAVVTSNIPVETVLDGPDAPVRSRFNQIDTDVMRVVKIGLHDTSACCGVHVGATGQIGVIRIFDRAKKKQGTRISFLAGLKALERAQGETATLRDLRTRAGCASAELPVFLQKALDRSRELAKEADRLWSLRLSEIVRSVETVAIGDRQAGVFLGEIPDSLVPVLAGMIAEATNGAGIVVSDGHIAISSKTLDAGVLLRTVRDRIGGKGGGSSTAARGRLDRPVTVAELVKVFNGGQ